MAALKGWRRSKKSTEGVPGKSATHPAHGPDHHSAQNLEMMSSAPARASVYPSQETREQNLGRFIKLPQVACWEVTEQEFKCRSDRLVSTPPCL